MQVTFLVLYAAALFLAFVTFADAVPSCDACRKLIGVDEGASSSDIKRAYHQKALESHPDKNPDDSTAQEKFMRVQGCYEALTKSKCTGSFIHAATTRFCSSINLMCYR
jgi:hypothetical protein